jgi:hypothetical protein
MKLEENSEEISSVALLSPACLFSCLNCAALADLLLHSSGSNTFS